MCFDSPVLCFVFLQGDAGPPGAEGEQGPEGLRVSYCKQPTNPFLLCVWVHLTQQYIYSPSFSGRCVNPGSKRAMIVFV